MTDTPNPLQPSGKLPRPVLDSIVAFPPNRDTLGGTAYWIAEEGGNILIDCPTLDETTSTFLKEQGGVRWLVLTHRGGMSQVKEWQNQFNCEVVIQEQEAYLLPGLAVTSFEQEFVLSPTTQIIWTPGHSPGSSCVYHSRHGGVLCSGRHLLPNQQGDPVPLRIAKTFHWPRQLRSIQKLLDRFTPDTLNFLCPGANTGFLRGRRSIENAYERLAQLDFQQLLEAKPGL